MKMNVKFVLLVLCGFLHSFGEGLTSEEEVDLKDTCCGFAESVAMSAASLQACSSTQLPEYISEEEEAPCREAVGSCCSKIFKLKDECAAGIKYAAEKRCSVPSTETGKRCCDECSIGRLTGESQGVESCGQPASGDTPPNTALRKNSFHQCCTEAATQPTTTEKPLETTTEKKIETTTVKKEKCAKNSCDHVCNDEDGKIRCQCHEGYRLQADKKTCKDINECAEALDDLCVAQDTVCHNTAGSFKCVPIKKREVGGCPPGFKKNVESQVCDDINECQHPRPPCPKYLCKNTIGGYTCAGKPGKPYEEESPTGTTEAVPVPASPRNDICPPGFRAGPDDECLDIDECEERSDDCQRLSQHCINTHGHFFCQDHVSKRCTPGFVINPTTGKCEDINECEDLTEVCRPTEVCINLPGAYNCKSKISTLPKLSSKTCQEGTRIRPGGTICEDIDECREGTHLCDDFQNCINTFGGHECRCKNGFELDSTSSACVDIDECALKMDNCSPGTHCLNMLGTFTCTRRPPAATTTTTAKPTPPPAAAEYDYEYYSEEDNSTDTDVTNPPPPTTTSSTTTTTPKPTTTPIPTTTTPLPITTESTTTSTTSRPSPTYPYNYPPRTNPTTRPPYSNRPERPIYTRPTSTTRRPYRPEERPRYPEYSFDPYGRPRIPETTTTELPRPERPYYPRPNYDRPRRPEVTTSTEEVPKPYIPKRPEEPRRPGSPKPTDPIDNPRPETTTEEKPKPFIPRRPDETPRPESKPEDPTYEIPKEPELGPKPEDDERPGFDINSLYCLDGYVKDEHGDCVDVNECDENRHLCSHLEECENRPGGYTCECIRGFTRDPSGWCVPATISSTTSTTTSTTTTPVPTTTSRRPRFPPRRPTPPPPSTVHCDFGYTFHSSEGRCVDIDECATNKHNCVPNEDCINLSGGYHCECGVRCMEGDRQPNVYYPVSPNRDTVPVAATPSTPTDSNIITVGAQYGTRGPRIMRPPHVRVNYGTMQPCQWGYKLTADRRCVDIDECARNVSQCGPMQRCENFFGGYSCQCPAGHRLSGQDGCEDIDECRFGSPCSYNGECVNTIGSYRCKCGEGFRNAPANDKVCMDIDECSEQPGVCDHECTNTWGGYRCYCRRGYRLDRDNRTCVDVDECAEWSAVRLRGRLCGGECVNVPGSYRCACPKGYRLGDDGKSCIDIDECETGEASCAYSSTPGEVCQNTRGSYHCHRIECPSGYRLESKHRCTRIQRSCPISDWSCLQQPSAYSYNFITIVSNIFLPSGRVDLFTMHGPAWRDSVVTFEMRMVSVQASPGVQPVDLRCFDMRPTNNICVISLVCSLAGPQVAELELSMSLYQRDQFAGSAVARLIVIVSQYDF